MNDEKRTLSDRLTPDQKRRLSTLLEEVVHDRITVSFSLDERDINGRRQSAFYSDTIRRRDDAEGKPAGFTTDEIRLLRLWLSKQVVAIVYDDAIKRGILSKAQATEEVRPILSAYDAHIAKLMADDKEEQQ